MSKISKSNHFPTFRLLKQLEESIDGEGLFLNQEKVKTNKSKTTDINKMHTRKQELQDAETNKDISYLVEEYELNPDLLEDEKHLENCVRNIKDSAGNSNARCSCKEISAHQEIKPEEWEQEVMKLMGELKSADEDKKKDKAIDAAVAQLMEDLKDLG